MILLKQLEIGYPNQETLLTIPKTCASIHGITAIIGANGTGKSTLIRTLAGLQKPNKGYVLMEGQNVHNMSPMRRAKNMAVVLTDPIQNINFTTKNLVAIGRMPYANWMGNLGESDEIVINWALQKTKLLHLAERKIFTLSDGELQKILIAKALAQSTKYILLDEPTAHLDWVSRRAIFNLLKEISFKKGIIISSHELNLVKEYADEIWGIKKNKLHKINLEHASFETLESYIKT